MKYSDILVHIDDSDTCLARIDASVAFGAMTDSHVVGVALAIQPTIPAYIGAELPIEVRDMQREAAEKAARTAIEHFEEKAERAGISFESRLVHCYDSTAADVLTFHARHADLNVLGQADPDTDFATLSLGLAEEVLFSSGRPVYLVPYIGMNHESGGKAVIAWDGGREAARAVHDALPLLERREEVVILVVDAGKYPRAHGEEPGADLATHLVRHDISVMVERMPSAGVDVAEVVLNFIAESGANLLVMGGYGHSRLREMALGGVTRTILREMTVPVLMSH